MEKEEIFPLRSVIIFPAASSYYIEKLTDILAERAWAKFQEIEAQGGYLVAV